MSDAPLVIGVVGGGTMGAGIAQLGCLAGMRTVLHDPFAEALERGASLIKTNLEKGAARGRWSAEDAVAAEERLATSTQIEDLADCDLVIEAAPEDFAIKTAIFGQLSSVCREDAVLATNTSSIPVTQIAAVAARPENVIGLHFFNPAPLMKLVELVAAVQSAPSALDLGRKVGEAMGKQVIAASDGPGFLVNRCGRPFGNEALRLLQEQLSTVQEVDHIYRVGGGYRMGPFELSDLVGIDVGLAVARSFSELSFGEPRWRPNPLQAQMVAAGRLGRKTGRGWYDYTDDGQMASSPQQGDELTARQAELLERVQCCIVNEGLFALGEGVGSAEDIDAGVRFGLNWPKGPIELGRELGFDRVLATMDGLFDRYREERYRAAPILRVGTLA